MTLKINFVFWDCDNTLVHTAEHHWRKHKEILKQYDIALDDRYRQKIYENNGNQNWAWMTRELGLAEDEQTYLDKVDAWYKENLDDIQIRKGVKSALDYFTLHRIPQAVVSNSRKKSVHTILQAKSLLPYFDFVLGREDYDARKPSPVPYQTALQIMQQHDGNFIDPKNCLVIEDDPLGVQSAEAAGMAVLFRPLGDNQPIKSIL